MGENFGENAWLKSCLGAFACTSPLATALRRLRACALGSGILACPLSAGRNFDGPRYDGPRYDGPRRYEMEPPSEEPPIGPPPDMHSTRSACLLQTGRSEGTRLLPQIARAFRADAEGVGHGACRGARGECAVGTIWISTKSACCGRDGRVIHVFLNAASGQLVGARTRIDGIRAEQEIGDNKLRLLVIEDDKDLNRQLVGALETAGYAVKSAPMARRGISSARRSPMTRWCSI